MLNKVNQKGASCYTISQNRKQHTPYISKMLKTQKNNRQKAYLRKIYLYLRTQT